MDKIFCCEGHDFHSTIHDFCPFCVLAEKDAQVQEVDEEAGKVRLILLLNHGHKGQYLDDGEMQCGECGFAEWDFKKSSLSELTKRIMFLLNEQIAEKDKALAAAEEQFNERIKGSDIVNEGLYRQLGEAEERVRELEFSVSELIVNRNDLRDIVTELRADNAALREVQGQLQDALSVKDAQLTALRERLLLATELKVLADKDIFVPRERLRVVEEKWKRGHSKWGEALKTNYQYAIVITALKKALKDIIDCNMLAWKFDHSGAMNATQLSECDRFHLLWNAGTEALLKADQAIEKGEVKVDKP